MSLIMGQIEPEHPELFALEFGKIAEYDFCLQSSIYKYWPISTKFGQMYMTIRSRMSLIIGIIRPELSESSTLELENLPYLTLFTL